MFVHVGNHIEDLLSSEKLCTGNFDLTEINVCKSIFHCVFFLLFWVFFCGINTNKYFACSSVSKEQFQISLSSFIQENKLVIAEN